MAETKEIRLIPAVNAVIFNPKREVLLTRRSQTVREPGKWCLPGGHFDAGEDWRTAVRRECNEEIGIVVTDEKLLGIYSDPTLTVTERPLQDGYYGQFITATFLVLTYEGDIIPNHEVSEWAWFPEGNLPDPIMKSHPIRIRDAYQFTGEAFFR